MTIRIRARERAGEIACRGERRHRKQQRHDRDREYALDSHAYRNATTERFLMATVAKRYSLSGMEFNGNACYTPLLFYVVVFRADIFLNLPVRFQFEGSLRSPRFSVRFRIVDGVLVHQRVMVHSPHA